MSQQPSQQPDWATESTALKRNPTPTMQQRGWDTSDGTTEGIGQKPTLEHTNGWMHNVSKWIKYLASNNTAPIGTVVMSMLTEQQYNEEVSGSWILCDGRSCAGTIYADVTGKNKVPNMVGRYLVGSGDNGSSKIGDLHEEVDSYVYSTTPGAKVATGGTQVTIGGSSIDMSSYTATIPSVSGFTSASISAKAKVINRRLYFPYNNNFDPNDIDRYDILSVVNRFVADSDNIYVNIPISSQPHSHTFNIPTTNDSIETDLANNIGYQNKSDSDLSNPDLNFSDKTKVTGLKTNYFIRIN